MSLMLVTACLQEVLRTLDWEEVGVRVNAEYLSNYSCGIETLQLALASQGST